MLLSCKAIAEIAFRKKGIFSVPRRGYKGIPLRARLKKMAEGSEWPIKLLEITPKHLVYILKWPAP